MSVFSTERPISTQELKAMREEKQALFESNRQLLKAQRLLEAQEAKAQEEMAKKDAEEKENQRRQQITEAATQRRNIEIANTAYRKAVSTLPKEARNMLLEHVILDIAMEAMWIDQSVKASPEFIPQTWQLFEEVLAKCDKVTGSSLLANMENTRMLSYINEVVTESANEIVNRILTEAKETKPLSISFTPTPEEVDIVDKKIVDADPKSISKVVKNKVLGIIKEEKEDGKLKAELFQELDEAGRDEEPEPETDEGEEGGPENGTEPQGNDVAESLMGLPMNDVMEMLDVNSENVPIFEHTLNKAVTLVSLADAECAAKNFEKASACYKNAKSMVTALEGISRYQTEDAIRDSMCVITEAFNSRLFTIRPGTGKAVRNDAIPPTHFTFGHQCRSQLKSYCDGMCAAIRGGNIVTETVEQKKNRLVMEHASRVLHSTIGATLFETQLIKNASMIRSSITESSGPTLLDSEVQNAAMIQTIVEYTILETLNTMQVYKFDKNAIAALKKM